jgi:hypothetical protein
MPGWSAVVNGRAQRMDHDGLGLMVIRPDCRDCQVTISYDGGTELRATCAVSLAVTVLGAFLVVWPAIKRFRSVPTPEIQHAR